MIPPIIDVHLIKMSFWCFNMWISWGLSLVSVIQMQQMWRQQAACVQLIHVTSNMTTYRRDLRSFKHEQYETCYNIKSLHCFPVKHFYLVNHSNQFIYMHINTQESKSRRADKVTNWMEREEDTVEEELRGKERIFSWFLTGWCDMLVCVWAVKGGETEVWRRKEEDETKRQKEEDKDRRKRRGSLQSYWPEQRQSAASFCWMKPAADFGTTSLTLTRNKLETNMTKTIICY